MEITSLHKYISLVNLADGSVEVLFAGQPCLYAFETGDGYWWKINPVFAKLTYGANIITDIPYCVDSYDSIEEAIANGLEKLHTLGQFTTLVDLPEDTYKVKDQIDEATHIQPDLVYVINKKSGTILAKFPREEFDKAQEVASQTPGHIAVTGNQVIARGLKEDTKQFLTGMPVMEQFIILEEMETAMTSTQKQKVTKPNMAILDKLLAGKELEKQEKKDVLLSIANGESHYIDKTTGLPLIHPDIQQDITNGVTTPEKVTENTDDEKEQKEYDEWVSNVKTAHPDKQLKFKSRIEGPADSRSHTTQAEVSGSERAYGIWDHDKKQGHVFSMDESELSTEQKDKKEQIVNALKKDRKFVSKYGKDAIYAVATNKAKQVAEEQEQIQERINKPQGHKETADPISDDSKAGRGRVKKMMGNKASVEVIASILARK